MTLWEATATVLVVDGDPVERSRAAQILRSAAYRVIEAESAEADIVIFPELALCGYPPEDLLLRKDFIALGKATARQVAAHTGKCAAVFGAPYLEKEGLFNAAIVA